MADPRSPRKPLISTLLAAVVIATTLLVLAVMRVGSFFRQKYVPIDQLKFPVLVVQPNRVAWFAEWDSTALQKFPERSGRTPENGTVIVDSAFDQFTQENVTRKKEGDLKWLARILLPGLRVKYTFDLRRAKVSGREALMEMIRLGPPLCEDPTQDTARRAAAQQQTTMDAVLDALHLYKPIEPTTQTAIDTPPTESPTPEAPEPDPAMHDPDKPKQN